MREAQRVPFFVINSFSEKPFEGNPAGIVPDADSLSAEVMQSFAQQLNLVETVFICKPQQGGDVRLRYFTPYAELPVAGHPTLAALAFLRNAQKLPSTSHITVETNAGLIKAWFEGEQIWLFQAMPRFRPLVGGIDLLAAALGIKPESIAGTPLVEVSDAGLGHIVARLVSLDALMNARSDLDRLAEICRLSQAREAQICAEETYRPDHHYHTRNFVPYQSNEDPACGNGNAALGAWLAKHGRLAIGQTIWVEQGDSVKRPASIGIRRMPDDGQNIKVAIGGFARQMIEGTLLMDRT